ncbi:6-phosphogluconolactonase [Paenibacillus sp. UNCCL117]|uniref:lactonase family protein n=1 Tax=unclassified Paenibacillus TaxID=185978 RepID=UPI000887EADB|nr:MULTISPECIES: lactonase family protein [unclassified Paenibacillus]SDC15366.1 6-phosphogluconolactonase [Paenibacillus sp. cl123]SFW17536.1 6-phosphogluconolactonase [Paenibacillus sp. UNCCL117]
MSLSSQRMLLYIGSYAEAGGPGVYAAELDQQTGELRLLSEASGLNNPTFLNVDSAANRLYAIADAVDETGRKRAQVVAFATDAAAGTMQELNRAFTSPDPTCHIQRNERENYLIQVSYHGGHVALISLTEDGRVGELLDLSQHTGHSVHPDRQDRPHPHSAFFSPDGRFLLVPDLGLDLVRIYKVDAGNGKLQVHADASVHPGAGPRHLAFRPDGRFAYVINELDSTIVAFRYDAEAGQLHTVQQISTLPAGFAGENSCAEIAVSEDGRFVYGSNRGHDSIAVFAADPASGELALIEHVSTQGKHPRHFALTPGGRFLVAANRDTDNVVSYHVDPATGKLAATGHMLTLSKPVCVKPLATEA